ncbi:hypothetical protein SAMN05444395_101487 [Flavobacterium fryxellicola]|uniref:Uncharacterized protein n=1 Tax=Flavobacterium fryxellicola TaxID=249352 RepID=A0A168AIL9_9FLAO|nr:hypothetical protein [Flavobacterium fryxellicola]OAB31509.1 hypothetical protein FBFR_01385 [Flavobacterium fryxellicola]SHN53204.1 hypothetical protein SAMN05444395_101487 [Flavobacterium fryxellicola]
MKLTQEQTDYIFNYVASFDIKWYELQVEITDHMVSRMEGIWEKDPELTFHQVKQYAENEFGRNGFKAMEEQRKRILQKEYNRSQRKMVSQFLKFPKIIGSILLGFLAYQGSFLFENLNTYILVLFALLFLFIIPGFYQWIKNRKIQGKRFLAVNYPSLTLTSLLLFPQLGMNLTSVFKEEIAKNHLLLIPFIFLWVFGVLFCVTGIHLDTKNVSKIKKQYQLS